MFSGTLHFHVFETNLFFMLFGLMLFGNPSKSMHALSSSLPFPGFRSLRICADLQDFRRSLQICTDSKKNDLLRNAIETPQQCQTNNKNV